MGIQLLDRGHIHAELNFSLSGAVAGVWSDQSPDLPEQFTFTTFCDWLRHELEAELGRRWEIEMNGVGVPGAYASAAG